MSTRRRTLAETWQYLAAEGHEMPYTAEGEPAVHSQMPSIYDDVLRLSFFRTRVEGDYSNLTMPRTFFGRSEITTANFRNTDLTESCMCWNDFIDCDFSYADLSRCDLRSSRFTRCTFAGSILWGADLRRGYFKGCDFTGASVSGAVAEKEWEIWGVQEELSDQQRETLAWIDDQGPEPDGG